MKLADVVAPPTQPFKVVYRYDESPSTTNGTGVWQRDASHERMDVTPSGEFGWLSESAIGDVVTRVSGGDGCYWSDNRDLAPAADGTLFADCDGTPISNGEIGVLASLWEQSVIATFPPRDVLDIKAPCYVFAGPTSPFVPAQRGATDIICVHPDTRVPLFVASTMMDGEQFSAEAISVGVPAEPFLATSATPELAQSRGLAIPVSGFLFPPELGTTH
jgi:hypothetical protein